MVHIDLYLLTTHPYREELLMNGEHEVKEVRAPVHHLQLCAFKSVQLLLLLLLNDKPAEPPERGQWK